MRLGRALTTGLFAAAVWGMTAPLALAQELGRPYDWQMGMQGSVTSLKTGIGNFHNLLLILITVITVFVMALLLYVMVKFNSKANPVPSKTSHNTLIEVLWTVIPIMILVVIAVPSFKILYDQERIPQNADITLKAIGFQWYWGYEYPDEKIGFESRLIDEKDLKQGQIRLLSVDNPVVVPVGKVVRVQATANDVIHAWTVPAFGVKKDAYPGRINEMWFKAEKTGTFYGQCSELCGTLHGYMPIQVNVVSEADYAVWLAEAKKKFAMDDAAGSTRVAAAKN